LLQPPTTENSNAANGSSAAACFSPLDGSIERPTIGWFATGEFKVGGSGRFLHAAPADALRAGTHMLLHAPNDRANAPQVWIPPAPPRVVRVANHISKVRRFAAEFTLQCHLFFLITPYWPGFSTQNVAKPSSLF
jgi:hypothetical protein